MMPKLIALARRRTSLGMPCDRHAEHFRRGHRVDVDAVGEGLPQLRDLGDMGEQPQLDLAVIGRDQLVALLARRRRCGSCGRPRCGSGCSAGSARTRRAGPSSSPPARRRCGRGWSAGGHRPAASRYRSISAWRAGAIPGSCAGSGWPCSASSSSTPAPVAHCPVAVFLAPDSPILPNRMSPSCLGRPMVNFSPAISWISSSSRASDCAKSPDSRDRICRSMAMPRASIRASTGDQRALQRLVDRGLAFGRESRLQHAARAAASRRHPRRRIRSPCRARPCRRSRCALPVPATCAKVIGSWPRCSSDSRSMPVAVGAGIERIGDQHGVVDRRHVDAVLLQHHAGRISGSGRSSARRGRRTAASAPPAPRPIGICPSSMPPPNRSVPPRCASGM